MDMHTVVEINKPIGEAFAGWAEIERFAVEQAQRASESAKAKGGDRMVVEKATIRPLAID